MEDWVTTKQAAGMLGVSDGRVRQLIKDGELPSEKMGWQNIFKRADVEAYAEKLRQEDQDRSKVGRRRNVSKQKTQE